MRIDDITGFDVEDSEPRLRLGDASRDDGGLAGDAPIYTSAFLTGVPAKPSEGDAAQCLWEYIGDDPTVMGIRDNRYVSKLGTMQSGDWGVVTDSNALIKCVASKDLVAIQSLGQSSNQTILITADGENDVAQIRNGLAFINVEQDRITLGVGNSSSIVITATDIRLNTSTAYITSGFVMLGELGGGTGIPPLQLPANAVRISPAPGVVSTKVYAAP